MSVRLVLLHANSPSKLAPARRKSRSHRPWVSLLDVALGCRSWASLLGSAPTLLGATSNAHGTHFGARWDELQHFDQTQALMVDEARLGIVAWRHRKGWIGGAWQIGFTGRGEHVSALPPLLPVQVEGARIGLTLPAQDGCQFLGSSWLRRVAGRRARARGLDLAYTGASLGLLHSALFTAPWQVPPALAAWARPR